MKQVEDPRGSKSEHKDQEGRQKGNVSLLKEDFFKCSKSLDRKIKIMNRANSDQEYSTDCEGYVSDSGDSESFKSGDEEDGFEPVKPVE